MFHNDETTQRNSKSLFTAISIIGVLATLVLYGCSGKPSATSSTEETDLVVSGERFRVPKELLIALANKGYDAVAFSNEKGEVQSVNAFDKEGNCTECKKEGTTQHGDNAGMQTVSFEGGMVRTTSHCNPRCIPSGKKRFGYCCPCN